MKTYIISKNRKDKRLLNLTVSTNDTDAWEVIHGSSFDGFCEQRPHGLVVFASFQKDNVKAMLATAGFTEEKTKWSV